MRLKPGYHFISNRLTGFNAPGTFHRVMRIIINHPNTVLIAQYLVAAVNAFVVF